MGDRADRESGLCLGADRRVLLDLGEESLGLAIMVLPVHVTSRSTAHVRAQLQRFRGFAISVTTKALPALLTPDDLPGAFAEPEAVTGWVDLTTATAAAPPARFPAALATASR